jgi:hypothetical protein
MSYRRHKSKAAKINHLQRYFEMWNDFLPCGDKLLRCSSPHFRNVKYQLCDAKPAAAGPCLQHGQARGCPPLLSIIPSPPPLPLAA